MSGSRWSRSSTPAHARAFSGFCSRNTTIFSESHDETLRVPPYRPGRSPLYCVTVPAADVADGGGVTEDWSVPTLGMNGLAPAVDTGWSSTSAALAESSEPPTITIVPTTMAATSRTTRPTNPSCFQLTPPDDELAGGGPGVSAPGADPVTIAPRRKRSSVT